MMKKTEKRQGDGQRPLRVGEQLRHVLAQTMREGRFHDAALLDASLITVTEVRVAPDLKNATAFVMPLGGQHTDEIVAALNRNAGYFQSQIARAVRIKFTPHLTFVADNSFDEASKIERLIAKIHEEDTDQTPDLQD